MDSTTALLCFDVVSGKLTAAFGNKKALEFSKEEDYRDSLSATMRNPLATDFNDSLLLVLSSNSSDDIQAARGALAQLGGAKAARRPWPQAPLATATVNCYTASSAALPVTLKVRRSVDDILTDLKAAAAAKPKQCLELFGDAPSRAVILHWTKTEDDAIRTAVMAFTSRGGKTIKWQVVFDSIPEGRLHSVRTAATVKDRWKKLKKNIPVSSTAAATTAIASASADTTAATSTTTDAIDCADDEYDADTERSTAKTSTLAVAAAAAAASSARMPPVHSGNSRTGLLSAVHKRSRSPDSAVAAATAAAAAAAAVSPARGALSPRMSPQRGSMRRVTSPLTAASSLQHMLEQTDGSSDEQRAIADSRKRRAARKPSSSKARKRKQNL
jgi:hypothetical protein